MTIQSQSSRTFFSAYNVASTGFVYNSSGESDSSAGWVSCKNDHAFIQIGIPTKDQTHDVIFRAEGKFDGLDRSASLLIVTKDSSHSIDSIHQISQKVKEIRLGVKVADMSASLTGSPVEIYAGVVLTDIN